jgi:hypothetical protein
VDLPIPGSPPSRTSDPGTSPPPSTLSNSLKLVLMRGTSSRSTSAREIGSTFEETPAGFREAFNGRCASSTKVFQAEQFGHLPTHRGET